MKNARAKKATPRRWTVGALMTSQPFTIGRGQTLETAHKLMRDHGIRHLPVLERGELIGVVSQRDLYFLETLRGVDMEHDTVEDAMSADTYAVAPDAAIGAVAKNMALHRYGCAVVIERGKVAGIFTATDALALISALARPVRSSRTLVQLGAATPARAMRCAP
jgi:acetoin utilization protein AcuB